MSSQHSIKNISFSVDQNENVVIVGHSSGGKINYLQTYYRILQLGFRNDHY